MLLGTVQVQLHVNVERFVQYVGLKLRQSLANGADRGVPHRDRELHAGHMHRARRRLEGQLHCATVGLDEPARTKLRAAVVARDDRSDITHTAVLQYDQHGSASGAMRFTVVAEANTIGAAGRPDDIRPAVMRRVRHFARDLANKGLRGVDVFNRRDGTEKSTTINNSLNTMSHTHDWISRSRHRRRVVLRARLAA